MSKIPCEITYTTEENDSGAQVESVRAECSYCGHQTVSFGRSGASVRRCFALLREECPEKCRNFYVEAGSDQDNEDQDDDLALGMYD